MNNAFWCIRENAGTPENPKNVPDFPSGSILRQTTPGEINVLTEGVGAAAHRHILLGGISLPSPSDGHYHIVADGQQYTVGASPHVHGDSTQQDYFLTFVQCDDAELASLVAYGVNPLAFAEIDADGNVGDLVEAPWDAPTRAWVDSESMRLFGINLPAGVNSGRQLVLWVLGSFLSRKITTDKVYR
ncbi:MAG: hypothetical protein ACE5FJ_08245 [Gemmatimonadales bacterium]